MDSRTKKLAVVLAIAVVVMGVLAVNPARSPGGIYTQLFITNSDGTVTTYNPTVTKLSVTPSTVTGLKVCSWLVTSSAYISYLLSLTQSASLNGLPQSQNSSGFRAYAPNSAAKSTCVSIPAPASGTITFSGSGLLAEFGLSKSLFEHFSQNTVTVLVVNGQIPVGGATVVGISGANSTTLVCKSNCPAFETPTSTSTTSTFPSPPPPPSASITSTITGTTTTLNGVPTILTPSTTNLVGPATSQSAAVISSTSLNDMGGTSALTAPSNMVCVPSDGTTLTSVTTFPSSSCFVYASTSTGNFYSVGVVGYNADGSPIWAWAKLAWASFLYGATFSSYPQLQTALTQYGSLRAYATAYGYCSSRVQQLGGC